MASTERAATPIKLVGGTMFQAEGAGELAIRFGLATLATGTVELDTGLSAVWGFVACVTSGTDTQTAAFAILEDLPTTTGTITIDGTKVDEGAAVANATSETFCWMAWGLA